MKRINSKFLKIIIAIISLSVILLTSAVIYLEVGQYSPTYYLYAHKINVSDDSIKLVGGTTSSATGLKGFKYRIEDDKLYVKLRYGLAYRDGIYGDFDIAINKNTENINYIYLEGRAKDDRKLIWEK
jgi:hypothetical protein